MYVCMYIYIYIYVYVYTYMYIYIYVYIYIYIYIYMYIYIWENEKGGGNNKKEIQNQYSDVGESEKGVKKQVGKTESIKQISERKETTGTPIVISPPCAFPPFSLSQGVFLTSTRRPAQQRQRPSSMCGFAGCQCRLWGILIRQTATKQTST